MKKEYIDSGDYSIELLWYGDEIDDALQDAVERALTKVGMQMETNAKNEITSAVYETPESPTYKRTGLLRNSITFALDGERPNATNYSGNDGTTGSYSGIMPEESGGNRSVSVGTNVHYAMYVEAGTQKMKPRPFIKPALANHMDEYKEIVNSELEKATIDAMSNGLI